MSEVNSELVNNINRFFTATRNNRTVCKPVERCEIDITEYFKKHKTLKNMEKIHGIGPKILAALELILTHGIDKAILIAINEKSDEICKDAFKGIERIRDCNNESVRISFDTGLKDYDVDSPSYEQGFIVQYKDRLFD